MSTVYHPPKTQYPIHSPAWLRWVPLILACCTILLSFFLFFYAYSLWTIPTKQILTSFFAWSMAQTPLRLMVTLGLLALVFYSVIQLSRKNAFAKGLLCFDGTMWSIQPILQTGALSNLSEFALPIPHPKVMFQSQTVVLIHFNMRWAILQKAQSPTHWHAMLRALHTGKY